MGKRSFPAGAYFHVYNKSIEGFRIFQNTTNIHRFLDILVYYNSLDITISYAHYRRSKNHGPTCIPTPSVPSNNMGVRYIAYCIMPTHYHLLIQPLKDLFISKYINDIENSYTRFLNTKIDRKGPLWVSRFSCKRVNTQEQMLHISRYIHLNPVTDYIVDKPEDWEFSSYSAYINNPDILGKYVTELSIKDPAEYKGFVLNRKDYQRRLGLIKKFIT